MTYFHNIMLRTLLSLLLVAYLSACGGGGGGPSAPAVEAPLASNVLSVTVDSGATGGSVNQLFASVTVCQVGSNTQCQTIDHLLVDTGSTGLRLFYASLSPTLNLKRLTTSSGLPLFNCAQFVDNSYAWGPVASADLTLGGKTAGNVPIQLIADPAYRSLADTCSASGTAKAMNTAADLGANGILGVGAFIEDCGTGCANHAANGYYFTCTSSACTLSTGTMTALANQVKNPIPLFATDNNGLIIDLPAVGLSGSASLKGSLIFGVGTQANNQATVSTVLTPNTLGYITTVLDGKSLNTSFIDSGSNGIYFDSATMTPCAASSPVPDFYCPGSVTSLHATLVGGNAVATLLDFSVGDALTMFNGPKIAAAPLLAGPIKNSQTFDWGLPFFYGRRVFLGIEGQSSPLGTGAYYAF